MSSKKSLIATQHLGFDNGQLSSITTTAQVANIPKSLFFKQRTSDFQLYMHKKMIAPLKLERRR